MSDSPDVLKFIHTADLHLGSKFCGISGMNPDMAKKMSKATFSAFDNIVSHCIDNNVDFLLISGDIYDSADRRIYEQLEFRKRLAKLSDYDISVYLAFGNHDPLSGWSAKIDWPGNVNIMPGNDPECLFYESGGKKRAAIVGMSYKQSNTTVNLTKYYPEKENSWPFTIGMLHCNLGTDTGHEPYSPCSVKDLTDKNYDYWALGHIHKPQIIQESEPVIVYPGNPQGRDMGESGIRGCYIVTVSNRGSIETEFIETAEIKWEKVSVNVSKISDENDLIKRIEKEIQKIRRNSGDKPTFLRLTLTGRSPVHSLLSKEGVADDIVRHFRDEEESNNFVFLEKIIDNTEPEIDLNEVAKREDIVGDIVQISDSLLKEEAKLQTVRLKLDDLFKSSKGKKFIEDLSDDEMGELVKEARTYLLDRFVGGDSK
nr:DNA repair exonuclease [Methanoplanus limicola]